jgi:hypothetical protein
MTSSRTAAQPTNADDTGGAAESAAPAQAAPDVDVVTSSAPASNIDVHASSEVSGYADTNHVFVVSPTIAGTLSSATSGWSATGRYLIDVVSAASADIVSTASRRWNEQRHVGTLEGSYKPETFGVDGTADLSVEPDYTSLTIGGGINKDLLDRNLTLLLGYDHRHDIAGRSGTPFSVFSHVIDHDGLKLGATMVLGRATILTLLGDAMWERGDTSKPYRYVPLFAPGTDVPNGASPDLVNRLRLGARPLEQVPLDRERFVLSARIGHRTTQTTLRADERLYADTWGMKATSTDGRFLVDVGRRVEIGPHVRFHAQTPVTFWQRAYVLRPGFDIPALRTGDRELGPLLNATGGGSLRVHVGSADRPKAYTLGIDLAVTQTWYLDTLYLSDRLSTVGGLSFEADL